MIHQEGDSVLYQENSEVEAVNATIHKIHRDSKGTPLSYVVRISDSGHLKGAYLEQVSARPIETEDLDLSFQEEEEIHEEDRPRFLSGFRKLTRNELNAVAGIIVVLLIWVVIFYSPSIREEPKTEPQIIMDTKELNEINLLDSADLKIKREAQSRIDSRSTRKQQLLDAIGFKK